MNARELIQSRRSTRTYKQAAVEREKLEQIMERLPLGIPQRRDSLPVRMPLPRTGNPVTWVK